MCNKFYGFPSQNGNFLKCTVLTSNPRDIWVKIPERKNEIVFYLLLLIVAEGRLENLSFLWFFQIYMLLASNCLLTLL